MEFNISFVEEQSEIINRAEEGSLEPSSGTVPVMIIGNNNVFEVSNCFSQHNNIFKVGNCCKQNYNI